MESLGVGSAKAKNEISAKPVKKETPYKIFRQIKEGREAKNKTAAKRGARFLLKKKQIKR
jgi:hypothetical protein